MSDFEGLKQFFGEDGNTAITYEQLSKGIAEKGIKLADLSLGEYVSKNKFDEQTRKFNDYKAKNDVSKYADYDTIKAELETLKAEKLDREMLQKLSGKKVREEFQRFVLSEIKSKVNENTPFEKAMDDYLKENAQYLAQEEKQPFFKSSSVPLQGGAGENKDTNQKMNALFRQVRNKN
ncbi:MAG: hypothetical protein IKW45_06650 [Clostridia bacterium]|nr:hypothetical protein [Clostridia bacterium]